MNAKTFLALLVLGWSSLLSSAASKYVAWEEPVEVFYKRHMKAGAQHDSLYTVAANKGLLSKRLSDALKIEQTQNASRSNKEEAPRLNGDPFTDSQEQPNSFKLGGSHRTGAKAVVDVVQTWSSEDKGKKGEQERVLHILLIQVGGKWLIDDVIGESGSLRTFLAQDDQ